MNQSYKDFLDFPDYMDSHAMVIVKDFTIKSSSNIVQFSLHNAVRDIKYVVTVF